MGEISIKTEDILGILMNYLGTLVSLYRFSFFLKDSERLGKIKFKTS